MRLTCTIIQNHLVFETIFNRSTHFEIRGVEMDGNNNQHTQGATKPKLLDQVPNTIHLKRYSIRTEQSYIQWIKRFIIFHNKRHPKYMGEKEILLRLEGTKWLMPSLLYGTGLRLMECVRLRVKDVDFSYNHIVVREGKGDNDRITMLPESLKKPSKGNGKEWCGIIGEMGELSSDR